MSKIRSQFTRKMFSFMAAIALMLGIGVGTLAISPSPASASGTHCAWWGVIQIENYKLPTGQYCFSVGGSGTRVDFTSGSLNTGWINNPSERVRFYDNRGNNYQSFWTYSATGTKYGFQYWKTGINGTARQGRVCGELMSSGRVIAATCNDIK